MVSYITLGTNDWDQAKPFWKSVSATEKLPLLFDYDRGSLYEQLRVKQFSSARVTIGKKPHLAMEFM